MTYSELMKTHLGSYKTTHLGIKESGKWRNREYDQTPLPFDATNIDTYKFEYVPDEDEGTNFYFWIRTKASNEIFCEFKLTESEFGRAKDDERHRQKLEKIYLPILTGKVSPDLLTPTWFFARYQLLRNIAYADPGRLTSVLFVVPKANERLIRPLAEMREWLEPNIRPFVSVLYIEEIVSQLRATLDSDVAAYYDAYAAKYMPPNCVGPRHAR